MSCLAQDALGEISLCGGVLGNCSIDLLIFLHLEVGMRKFRHNPYFIFWWWWPPFIAILFSVQIIAYSPSPCLQPQYNTYWQQNVPGETIFSTIFLVKLHLFNLIVTASFIFLDPIHKLMDSLFLIIRIHKVKLLYTHHQALNATHEQ